MSQQTPYNITCPKCGSEQEVVLYDAINLSQTPELKDQLIKNTLNGVVCEDCAFDFRVDKNLLYNDGPNGLLIYWMPSEMKDLEQTEAEFNASVESITKLLPPDLDIPAIQVVHYRLQSARQTGLAIRDNRAVWTLPLYVDDRTAYIEGAVR